MPAQKLSYKVDVDTGSAVNDLERLGQAGGDAGRDIAKGFDQAKTASQQALEALSGKLDQVEADAKGAASAVAAIKAHLTVDVDDAKVAGFVSDLKSKMGVAFDDVEQDAREFAAVLERGVDMSKTVNEIHGVGTALDTTRGSADQSRSVFANMVGNTTQDLGELGGVAGTLGVGIGQLGEYAADGTISLKGLAGMAGPMALLAAAGAGVQAVMKNIAETKAFNVDQVKAFADAFAELGDSSSALATSLDGVFNARVDNDSLWGQLTGAQKTQDLATNLAEVGVTLSDIDRIIRSGASDRASFELLPDVQNLDAILQTAGLSVNEYEAIMDGVFETTTNWTRATDGAVKSAEFFGSSLSTINEQIKSQLIDENPFAIMDMGLFQTGGHLVDLKAIWNDVVRDMSDDDASFDTTAGNVDVLAEAFRMSTDEVIALAREQTTTTKTTGELGDITHTAADAQADAADAAAELTDHLNAQADALQSTIDKQTEMIDASHDWADSQQAFRDATADLPAMLEATNKVLDDSASTSEDYTDALREQRNGAEDWVDQLVATRIELDRGRGVTRSAAQTQDDYAEGLGRIAGHLNADVIPAVAAYYANVLQIPENKQTEFEVILATGDQAKIEAFIAENSGTKDLAVKVSTDTAKLAKVDTMIQAVGDGAHATVVVGADASAAYATKANLQKPWFTTLWITPRTTSATIGGRVVDFGNARSVAPAGARAVRADVAVAELAAAPPVPSPPSHMLAPITVAAPAVAPINVTVNAGVIGNRYDVSRWVRGALRDQQRLGRMN